MNDQEFKNEDVYLHPWTCATISKMTAGDCYSLLTLISHLKFIQV